MAGYPQPSLTTGFVSRALSAPLPASLQQIAGGDTQVFSGVTTDSRRVPAGSLFVALKGDRVDGHDYLEAALAAGARGLLCRRGHPVPKQAGAHVYAVEDTLEAFRRLAGAWRREFSIPLVLVAGSVGKTTTKELLAAILGARFPQLLKTTGSLNGFVGIPMTLLELRPEHQAAVVEVGIDEIGAMEKHLALVAPTASIVTAIGPEHLEKLRDVPTVAREEGLALSHVAAAGGIAAVNVADPWLKPFARTLRGGTVIRYGLGAAPDPSTLAGRIAQDGTLEAEGAGWDAERFTPPLPGQHNASNLLGALAVARGLGLSPAEIRKGLSHFRGAEGRSELRELPGGTQVICDYYNAQPPSVEAALGLLGKLGRGRATWACLGDMLEMGAQEESLHRELAAPILKEGVSHVLLYGERMKWLAEALRDRGYSGTLHHFATHGELAAALLRDARPGDTILIKGSRSMRMEEVWKAFEHPARERWGKHDGGS
jgi:UDP-N-acetylmuramoyl-tripeptide--D-alanyl-D-alanine ligase